MFLDYAGEDRTGQFFLSSRLPSTLRICARVFSAGADYDYRIRFDPEKIFLPPTGILGRRGGGGEPLRMGGDRD